MCAVPSGQLPRAGVPNAGPDTAGSNWPTFKRAAAVPAGMAKRILVPVDGSEQAHAGAEFVIEEFPDATMILLHVINPAEAGYSAQASIPSFSEEWYEGEKERAERLFDEIESAAGESAIAIEHEIDVGRPTKAIVDMATETDVDHIVMGSHGRSGVSRMLLGSVAETVVRRSPVPVTVVH